MGATAIVVDLEIEPDVARRLIADNPDQPLWPQFRAYGHGSPGVTRETGSDWVVRTQMGCVAGGARVHDDLVPGLRPSIDVAIDPRYRRRGYATALYNALKSAGIDAESGSDASMEYGTMTRLGFAFMVGRRRKANETTSASRKPRQPTTES